MAPVKQYKFVGGPMRKRRRRQTAQGIDGNVKTPISTASKATASAVSVAEEPVERQSLHESPAKPPSPIKCNSPRQAALIPPTEAPPLPLSPSTTTDFDLLLNWPNGSSFMNPFLDAGPFLSDPSAILNGQFLLPSLFNSDLDFSHPHSTPSADSSAEVLVSSEEENSANNDPQDDQAQATDFIPDSTEKITLLPPSPNSQRPSNSTDTLSRLLTRYDQEFCILPLTTDFAANPFRYNVETGRGSQLLLHCILALSYKHINRDTGGFLKEATHHKKQAVQLLRDMEGESRSNSFEPTFLDAVLILMTLDCATSAHGPWLSYLHRAHRILEATETLNIPQTPRMKAQIEMLVWWDVTLAMTSRQGCVLSESTIMSQFNSPESTDPTFYNISGCPEDLFKYMVRLGAYAREYEVAATMTCVTFDMGPVLEVEKCIREWSAPEYDNHPENFDDNVPMDDPNGSDPEELAQYKQDLYHCAEAWRYGLLIYIEKVFKWRKKKRQSPLLGFMARKALNNVSSCRRNLMLQKQLLLPVFLAGCETKDELLRQEARDYCNWWNEKTRYDMFLTATALLEEVWVTEDPDSWWGSIIDQKTRAGSGPMARQYLFG